MFGLPVSCKVDSSFREGGECVRRAVIQSRRVLSTGFVFCSEQQLWVSFVGLQNLTGCACMCCEVCITFPDSFCWSSFTYWKLKARKQRQKCFNMQLLACISGQCFWSCQILLTLHLRLSSSCGTEVKLQAPLFWAQNSLCGFRNKGLELV